ncbi:MAG: hypothetical protein KKA05_10845 [Alphaproteobacteria bacterium]|nr:hypothetical protein [Alphaproteobacteria bacterium]
MGLPKKAFIKMDDEELKAFFIKKRKKLKQSHPKRMARKRFLKETRPIRVLRLYSRPFRTPTLRKPCQILDAAYALRNEGGWIDFSARKSSQDKSFDLHWASLLDEPVKTFELLAEIAKAESECPRIQLNYRSGTCADISPILILRLMHDNFPSPHGGYVKGVISEAYEDIFKRLGLIDALGINVIYRSTESEASTDQVNFAIPLKNWSPKTEFLSIEDREIFNQSALERVGDTANSVANQLVEWVNTHGNPECLIPKLHERVRSAVSELLDNARRHGIINEAHCEWHMCGLLQKRIGASGKTFTICNLAILNRGDSIADTLQTAEESVKKEVEDYVNLHKKEIFEEALWVAYSLQDDISCTHTDVNGERPSKGRGIATAMMDVLNDAFDQEDIDYKPSFTIISGQAWLTASYPYNVFQQRYGRRTLALNQENDLTQAPDIARLGKLPWRFPGTIISFRFMVNIEGANIGDEK